MLKELYHNNTDFKKLSRSVTVAICQHRRRKKIKHIGLIARDRKSFFWCIDNKSNSHHDLHLSVNDAILSDADVADALLLEFANNFMHYIQRINSYQLNSLVFASSELLLNCTQDLVAKATNNCPNTNSCPDRVSIKIHQKYHHDPSNYLFSEFNFWGLFPQMWKQAVIMPLYTDRRDNSAVGSCRSISLCSSIGKLLEKM